MWKIILNELSGLVLALVIPGTYGQMMTPCGNKPFKYRLGPDSNTQPEGLQCSTLTTVPSEHLNYFEQTTRITLIMRV